MPIRSALLGSTSITPADLADPVWAGRQAVASALVGAMLERYAQSAMEGAEAVQDALVDVFRQFVIRTAVETIVKPVAAAILAAGPVVSQERQQ